MVQPLDTALNLKDIEMRPLDNHTEEEAGVSYITIHPTAPVPLLVRPDMQDFLGASALPSFESSQFDVVLRRQRQRPPQGGGVKMTAVPSRFLNLSREWEFAGWGSISHVHLSAETKRSGEEIIRRKRDQQTLGHLLASSFPGNDILGGIFYTIPAVLTVSGALSPISVFIATLVLFLWRPVMEELESAFPISGAPYTYLLNVSSKTFALVGAALLLLDFASITVVSAATASSYVVAEIPYPVPLWACSMVILVLFVGVAMIGIKESAHFALSILVLHLTTMILLLVAATYRWAGNGNTVVAQNWQAVRNASLGEITHQIFNGICIGMLGLTGFECTPSYVSSIKPGRFSIVLRNLHYTAVVFNATCMLAVVAVVPMEESLASANVLARLAQETFGPWLRIWTVVDAALVLCGGVLSGILSSSELLHSLAEDRVLPSFFKRQLSSGARQYSILAFAGFCAIVYAVSGASLSIVSKMFSVVWLSVMALFPLAALLLKFNRGRIRRTKVSSLAVVLGCLFLIPIIMAGNILIDPTTIGYAAGYVAVLVFMFSITQKKTQLLRWLYWAYDQSPRLHSSRAAQSFGDGLVRTIRKMRRQPVCLLARTDDINNLVEKVLYVSRFEETSHVKLVHFCGEDANDTSFTIPSEMEGNWKILDEAFPEITIDLVIVHTQFTPATVAALAKELDILPSLMFMSCPGVNFAHSVADMGTRIITL